MKTYNLQLNKLSLRVMCSGLEEVAFMSEADHEGLDDKAATLYSKLKALRQASDSRPENTIDFEFTQAELELLVIVLDDVFEPLRKKLAGNLQQILEEEKEASNA